MRDATAGDVLSGAARWAVGCGDAPDVLTALPAGCVQCCVTSPPYYGLRDYGHAGQVGLEATPAEYVARLVGVFREVRRVLRDDGTLWLNLGSSYAGSSMSDRPGGTNGKEGSAKRVDRMFEKGAAEAGAAVNRDADEPFALRDDLTPEEVAYVLSELAAAFRQGGEVP